MAKQKVPNIYTQTLQREQEKGKEEADGATHEQVSVISLPVKEIQGEEAASMQISLWIKPSHDDKLDELRSQYKRAKRRKIGNSEILRILIEKATVEDLL